MEKILTDIEGYCLNCKKNVRCYVIPNGDAHCNKCDSFIYDSQEVEDEMHSDEKI